jgi:hypothetical protein
MNDDEQPDYLECMGELALRLLQGLAALLITGIFLEALCR